MWEACTHRIDASPYPTHGDDFPMMRVPRTHASRLVFHLMPCNSPDPPLPVAAMASITLSAHRGP
jgi:hypothetical protein